MSAVALPPFDERRQDGEDWLVHGVDVGVGEAGIDLYEGVESRERAPRSSGRRSTPLAERSRLACTMSSQPAAQASLPSTSACMIALRVASDASSPVPHERAVPANQPS